MSSLRDVMQMGLTPTVRIAYGNLDQSCLWTRPAPKKAGFFVSGALDLTPFQERKMITGTDAWTARLAGIMPAKA